MSLWVSSYTIPDVFAASVHRPSSTVKLSATNCDRFHIYTSRAYMKINTPMQSIMEDTQIVLCSCGICFRFGSCVLVYVTTRNATRTRQHTNQVTAEIFWAWLKFMKKKRKISRNVICMNAFHKWCAIISWQKEEWFSILHTCISVLLDTEETM